LGKAWCSKVKSIRIGRARHSVRAGLCVRTSGGQRTARPTGAPSARHICRTKIQMIFQPRQGRHIPVFADGHHVAPDGAFELMRFILQICQSYGLRRLRVLRAKKPNANCPNRPSQNEYRKRVFKCGMENPQITLIAQISFSSSAASSKSADKTSSSERRSSRRESAQTSSSPGS